MIRKLLSNLREYKKVSILSPVITVFEVIFEILIPFVISVLIDRGVEAGSMKNVLIYGGIMMAMSFAALLCGVMGARFAATASTGLAGNLRQSMFEKIQTFGFANIDRFSTAGLVTRMTTDVTNVQNAFQMIIRVMIRSPLMLIGALVLCFSINVRLSLIFLAAIIILAVILFTIMGMTFPIFDRVFDRYDNLNASVQENISAIRVVKAFVREDYENQKFEYASAYVKNLSVKAEKILALNAPTMMFAVYFCMIGLSWLGAHYIVGGTLTTGQLTSLFTYITQIMSSLMMLTMVVVMFAMSLASARRIVQVFDEEPDIVNPDEPVMEVPDGSIDFNHVNFVYGGGAKGSDAKKEYVLKDVDLHIKSGETIGVIGSTGSGKSSLVNLISRLYDTNEGEVKVGGKNVREYDLEVLRDSVSVVLQKNVLFSGTVLDNLRWGREDATEEECKRACEIACADEFIEAFPDKYETWIEREGSNVSGGQRQRLCIARALLKRPRVLILDDSTSAVDTATDSKIRKRLSEKVPDMTTIIIAQRISSVEHADRIIVMDNGEVNAFDTPQKLLEENDIYKDIYETQINGADFDET